MPRSYKICSPFVPGVGGHDTVAGAVSDQLAANERVDNTRVVPVRRGADMRLRAAVEKFKLWDNGRRLRVKFIDGVPEVQDKVAKIAKEWETVANIRLDFVTGTASELRVSFAEKGFSWSTVGTDALTVGRTKATVNLGWLEPSTATARVPAGGAPRVRSRPRHDPRAPEPGRPGRDPVGQAEGVRLLRPAGLVEGRRRHEHLRGLLGGQHEPHRVRPDVDHGVRHPRLADEVGRTRSVGTPSSRRSTSSSCASSIPKGGAGTVELDVGGSRVAADLAASGEVDTYHFAVAEGGDVHHVDRGSERHGAHAARSQRSRRGARLGRRPRPGHATPASCASCCPATTG